MVRTMRYSTFILNVPFLNFKVTCLITCLLIDHFWCSDLIWTIWTWYGFCACTTTTKFSKPLLNHFIRWSRVRIIFFLLESHKVDFIAPREVNKAIFWPHSRKKIVCDTGKTLILLVWLLPSLCSGIKLHTRKINFFFPSCTIYYIELGLAFW